MTAGLVPLAIGLLGASGGHVAFKVFFRDRRVSFLVLAAAGFLVGQVGFFLALQDLRVGAVYMATGLVQVLILAVAHFVLDDRVSGERLLAVGAIVSGVVVYNL